MSDERTEQQTTLDYVSGHTLDRVPVEGGWQETEGGKVSIEFTKTESFIMWSIKAKPGDTTGRYVAQLAEDFSDTLGGDILVFESTDGTPAPDGTLIKVWCETK